MIQSESDRQDWEPLLNEVIEFRKVLHAHPELSWREHQTTERIEAFLKKHGIQPLHRPTPTGGWVDLIFQSGKPFLLLRADIDALPITDTKKVAYRSRNRGICHACGHDAHTATMAAVAVLLTRMPRKPACNVRVVFQPAEETIPAGAPTLIEKGVLKDVKAALAMHVDPRIDLGTISLTPGWVNMQSVRLEVTFSGPGGHSARPYETADLIWLASRMVQESYQMIYRRFNWLESPMVLTFTEIEAGEGYNIIPSRLKATATLRLTSEQERERFYQQFRQLLGELCAGQPAKADFSAREGAPPVINDIRLIERLQKQLPETGLKLNVLTDFRSPGGDDFGYYARQVPGAMVRFGVRTGQSHPPLHTGDFDVPDALFQLSVPFFARQVLLLSQDDELLNG
ncbi:MAG: amidohydrolase [Calditrichaeota bacterium]|nr:MAG: amidohydrolase [Calditrichota bacterium]